MIWPFMMRISNQPRVPAHLPWCHDVSLVSCRQNVWENLEQLPDRPSDSSNDVTSSREWPWWVNSPAAGPKREAKSRGIFSFNQPPNYLGRWKYLCVCKQANSYNCCCCKTSRALLAPALHGSGKLDKAPRLIRCPRWLEEVLDSLVKRLSLRNVYIQG